MSILDLDHPLERGIEHMVALVGGLAPLLSDVGTLQKFADASAEARRLINEAEAGQRTLIKAKREQDAQLASERAEHDNTLLAERQRWERLVAEREKSLKSREAHTDKLHAQAQDAADAAERLRGELQKKLDAVRSAAA